MRSVWLEDLPFANFRPSAPEILAENLFSRYQDFNPATTIWGDARPMWRCLFVLFLMGHFCALDADLHAAQPLWQSLIPQRQVESDPSADYSLDQQRGPWLILAATFSGAEGEADARELVLELRKESNLPAFYYAMTFERDQLNVGRGIDVDGARIRRRYNRGSAVLEHAVLVGEFTSVDDPDAQELLERVKYLQPECLKTAGEQESTQSLASVRKFHNYVRKNLGKQSQRGPLGYAFLTRNPLLPKEYFAPRGVDDEIAKWNEGLEYSLMKAPGRYSMRVATFRGRSKLHARDGDAEDIKSHKATEKDPLVVAGRNAHLLTVALRKKGWEAYEFHNRQESYVAVGSFDDAQQLADGRIVIDNRDAQIIIKTFGAMTPNNVFNRPAAEDIQLEQQKKQQFLNSFAKQQGSVAQGFHPKRFVGLPFDIHPEAVQVPRRSVSAAYARN